MTSHSCEKYLQHMHQMFATMTKTPMAFIALEFAFRNLVPCATPSVSFGASNPKNGMHSGELHQGRFFLILPQRSHFTQGCRIRTHSSCHPLPTRGTLGSHPLPGVGRLDAPCRVWTDSNGQLHLYLVFCVLLLSSVPCFHTCFVVKDGQQ